ncbi:gamma-glutamyltransferase [Salisediminibacterium halotolerans]|uniref:gamma-glutamyltransferase n=1 Tax=Salisediminibacterium halotolerans TaxID=517425 RepID=UPI000EB1C21B|nr:gamma-glutamyltransferase [Salisediminibacterium halotolerans]RLJ73232.1 gamma-glutamyltranspeptidase/glutathione hydrolase [Actinophytocola xinjiangensis]RPE86654.1 gamma-glutamyltranspeptidase/glutathione hydrolase [Salisediminibacterium halotolerans]TWG34029.1 gamma-glutamyltranspeptidase/glutathione hydrolase [Salisediminibacterium halotolerans]GEL08314.1 gamma-glutamyltranspeptidase [Salisediminibacterium halotolerans]
MNHYKKDLKRTYILSIVILPLLIAWNFDEVNTLFDPFRDPYAGGDSREFEDEAIDIAGNDNGSTQNQTENNIDSETGSVSDAPEPGVYGVSSAHPLAVEEGMDVLEDGGNAVDAAVAVSFTLGVVEPYGSGLGGGGSMLIHDPDEGIVNYDYREAAPESAQTLEDVPERGMAVPGFVKGMETVYEEMGSGEKEWEQLLAATDDYVDDGYQVDEVFADQISSYHRTLDFSSADGGNSDEEEYTRYGEPVGINDTIQPDALADTLERLKAGGSEEFYEGELAESLAETMNIPVDDLASYEVHRTEGEEVASGTWEPYDYDGESREQTIYGSPSPASSTIVIQALQMASRLDLTELIEILEGDNEDYEEEIENVSALLASELDGLEEDDKIEVGHLAHSEETEAHYYHLMSEITDAVYSDRLGTLGDPQFDEIDHQELNSEAYINNLIDDVEMNPYALSEQLRDGEIDEDELDENEPVEEDPDTTAAISDETQTDLDDPGNTTHFVIVDDEGRMVSATHSLGEFFGSGVYNDGYFINNQTDNFSENEDSMNRYEPGKRPRTFVSPMIFTETVNYENEEYEVPSLGFGSPGGSRIPAMQFQTAMEYQYGQEDGEALSLQEAIMQPRFYTDGNILYTEEQLGNDYAREILQYSPVDDPAFNPDNVNEEDFQMGYDYNVQGYADSLLFYGGIQGLGFSHSSDNPYEGIYGGGDERRNGSWGIREAE